MSLTVDELYEAYMDDTTSFAEDVFHFFGGTGMAEEYIGGGGFIQDYGMYLPTFDPTRVELATRTKEVDLKKALDLLDISTKVADRVYDTEADVLSTKLGAEIGKAREISGGTGIRSGKLESTVADTIGMYGDKVADLGDRLQLQTEEDKNKYSTSAVDAALDFDKADRDVKREFYNRTLAAIDKISAKAPGWQSGAAHPSWEEEWLNPDTGMEETVTQTCDDCYCSGEFDPMDNCSVYCCGSGNAIDECAAGYGCDGVCGSGKIDGGCGCGEYAEPCNGVLYCDLWDFWESDCGMGG